jgi:hypothetical protein
MSTAERFVAFAYILFTLVVLVYVVIQSRKLVDFERKIEELERRAG